MHTKLFDALKNLVTSPEGEAHAWVAPYTGGPDKPPHQFVLFLKPEVTDLAAGVKVDAVIRLILETLEDWEVQVGAQRVLRGDYLEKHRIMDGHYGVINGISHGGRAAITASAEKQLVKLFAAKLDAGAAVLGGHEFLAQHPGFSPLALSTLSDNLGTAKLGGGTYALDMNLLGRSLVVLNPFHPYQLEPYYNPKSGIVVLECSSDRPWADLRQKLAGATEPSRAAEGSLRNKFLANKEALGLADVSQGANGIHLSAGPLEGMVELRRFLTDHEAGTELALSQTVFGLRLEAAGLDDDTIADLAGNCTLVQHGHEVSAFDLTEEVDAEAAIGKITPLIVP
jgi:hypothetical protein